MSLPGTDFQGFPKLDSAFTNPNLTITIPWYRFLVNLWRRTGGSNVPQNAQALYDQSSGGAEEVLNVGNSPLVFTATLVGFLTVFGAQVEINRTGQWRLVSLVGGSFWLMNGDLARVTWTGVGPSARPTVVW